MIGADVGRAQQHSPGDAIKLGHRERGEQLIGDSNQHRAAGEFAVMASQAGQFIAERHHLSRVRNRPALQVPAEIIAERENFTRGHFRTR